MSREMPVLSKIFEEFFELLDGVMYTMGGTIWFDDNTTAHEALVILAEKYDTIIAKLLQEKIVEEDDE